MKKDHLSFPTFSTSKSLSRNFIPSRLHGTPFAGALRWAQPEMHWQDRLGAMAGVHDLKKVQLYFRSWSSVQHVNLGNSLTTEEQNILYIAIHIYTSWLYKIIQDYTRLYKILQDYTRWFSKGSPTFSWCFPKVFQWISLQDSELHGLRRPSGYPIHDRRTSAPFRTEGATGLRQMGTTRSHEMAMNAMTFLVQVTQVFFVFFRGWKHQPDFTKSCCSMWNTMKHHHLIAMNFRGDDLFRHFSWWRISGLGWIK